MVGLIFPASKRAIADCFVPIFNGKLFWVIHHVQCEPQLVLISPHSEALNVHILFYNTILKQFFFRVFRSFHNRRNITYALYYVNDKYRRSGVSISTCGVFASVS